MNALVRGGWLSCDCVQHLRLEPVEVRVVKGQRSLELVFQETSEVQSSSADHRLSGDVVKS